MIMECTGSLSRMYAGNPGALSTINRNAGVRFPYQGNLDSLVVEHSARKDRQGEVMDNCTGQEKAFGSFPEPQKKP
jgi:hypothetical protein